MSLTRAQAGDLLAQNYGDWSSDDPEWWEDMVEVLMQYPSVRRLRHPTDPRDWFGGAHWTVPAWWPGASEQTKGSQG